MPSNDLNAWADGRYVVVTTRMMAFAADDAELAFVVAHEMAHNLLHHRKGATAKGVAKTRDNEEAADRFAVRLAMAAAYDLADAESFLDGLLDRAHSVAATHPAPGRRLALLRAAITDSRVCYSWVA